VKPIKTNKMEALLKIQGDLKVPKTRVNNFAKYKFRNCEDILNAVKPLLVENNCTLTLTDEIKEICGVLFMEATATIKCGKEVIVVKSQAGVDINKKGMDKAQTFGTASSYSRKYALNGLFLIDDTADADETNDHKEKEVSKKVLSTERFVKALEAVKTGDYSIEELEKKYDLSETQQEQIKELV
jgi:hypothetical protein